MERIKSFSVNDLQVEIQPLLNDALNNSSKLKEVLQKYGLLESVEIQIKLKTDKLGTQEIELRNSNQLQIRLNANQLSVQEFSTACCSWCVICGDFRRCGTCPNDPSQCG